MHLDLSSVCRSTGILPASLTPVFLLPNHIKSYHKYGCNYNHSNENPKPEKAATGSRGAHVVVGGGRFDDPCGSMRRVDTFDSVFGHKAFSAWAYETPISVVTLVLASLHQTFVNIPAEVVVFYIAIRTVARVLHVEVTDYRAFLFCAV